MSKPSRAHLTVAEYLLRYLSGTVDLQNNFQARGFELIEFSDFIWGNNSDNGK